MGCFSFICEASGLPIISNSHREDACRLFLLKDGKVIEDMKGKYDSYGRVLDSNGESIEWKMPWNDVVDLMLHYNKSNGIAAYLEDYYHGQIPTTRSEDDPNQGFGYDDEEEEDWDDDDDCDDDDWGEDDDEE
jgi:hypothetical protein